ncbi:DEHA2F06446p [Anopheles sinensis]|uniref:DEHA2F06446p n=1 Tax=Anopheles sinensis TaxID=74873 RepID=A0A084W4X3_ANOSI|nr:DEHA2F06446p [Anopheles sinensis]
MLNLPFAECPGSTASNGANGADPRWCVFVLANWIRPPARRYSRKSSTDKRPQPINVIITATLGNGYKRRSASMLSANQNRHTKRRPCVPNDVRSVGDPPGASAETKMDEALAGRSRLPGCSSSPQPLEEINGPS